MVKYKFLFLGLMTWSPLVYAQRDSTAVDSLLLKQIESQMQPAVSAPVQQVQPRAAQSTNPNTSVIGDFQGSYRTKSRRKSEVYLNEAEVSFQSVVDPYVRADFFLSVARDPASGKFEADLEEGYLTTMDLPAHLQLKAGKFRSAVGRLNPLHPHANPFIDMPTVYRNYVGEDGLADEGFSLSWLVPNPFDFYQELTFEATDGSVESPSFAHSNVDRYLYVSHLKNFWDLTPNTTLELGLTGIAGPNDSGFSTTIGAFDLTYKWKPLQFNTYQSLVWQTEVLFSGARSNPTAKTNSWGLYSFLTYQLEKRWFLTGRFDYSNLPYSSSAVERAYSGTLGWYATEFQKIELEAKTTTSNFQDQFHHVLLRWIFVIGSHGAHQY